MGYLIIVAPERDSNLGLKPCRLRPVMERAGHQEVASCCIHVFNWPVKQLLHKLFREVYHQASKARRVAFWHPFPQRWHKSLSSGLLPPGWGGGGRKLGRTAQHSFGRNCGGGGRRSDCVLAITLIIFVLNWCWRMRWFVLWPFCWLHPLLHAHHHALHLFEQLFLWSPGCKEMGLLQKILETQKTIITMLQMQESRPQAQAQSWAPLLSMVSANYTSFIQDSSDHRDDIIYLYMYISIYFFNSVIFWFQNPPLVFGLCWNK